MSTLNKAGHTTSLLSWDILYTCSCLSIQKAAETTEGTEGAEDTIGERFHTVSC